MPDWVATLRTLLELGWPALVTLAFFFLARQYMATVEGEIAYLRTRVAELEAELIRVKRQLLDAHLTTDE